MQLSRRYKILTIILSSIIALALLWLLVYLFAYRAPRDFPDTGIVTISTGDGLIDVSHKLKDNHLIRSTILFRIYYLLLKHTTHISVGEYYFDHAQNNFQIAKQVAAGQYNINQLKTTIPEGSTIFDISLILKRRYPLFDTVHFLTLSQGREGYLFPDTYLFGADVRPETVIATMSDNFMKKINDPDVSKALVAFGKTQGDVMKMASILEGEARQTETRRMIAGILWKRISLGIPLQVDAAFRYVNGKTTAQLTTADLKIDSPYNTYLYKGFPPTPISNPGLDSIMAAVTPIQSDYLYFLTGDDGTMHYAKTLDEHVRNKNLYLK